MIVRSGFKCHFCDNCDGHGCVSELPGMGGAYGNENFIQNCADWDKYSGTGIDLPLIRLAPITGAVQNVGYDDEKEFYLDIIKACIKAKVGLSIGDGYPDEKIQFGIDALQKRSAKGAVFIKPYENKRIFERMEWASDVSEIIGIDIDSYAILTMRNLVNLQKKTASDLLILKKHALKPFAVKGVFRAEDIELVKMVKPDIVVVSNHGGRVETERGSSVDYLSLYGRELRNYTGEIWIDGGIRKKHDLLAAKFLGASEVMIGRPFISAILKDKEDGISIRLKQLLNS